MNTQKYRNYHKSTAGAGDGVCPLCKRRVGRMRSGALRRHMKEKGTICNGSWRTERRIAEVLEQIKIDEAKEQAHRAATAGAVEVA